MAHTTEGATESVEAVRFGFLTDEEVKKHSFVKITNPTLLDSVETPMPGGLYDPAMGPLDGHSLCKSCGQRSFHCPGHCGHIDLSFPVYNPLLFNMLYNILQRTCINCFHFRAPRSEVEMCASQLELIAKGDVIGAMRLDSMSLTECSYPEDSSGSNLSCSTVTSGAQYHSLDHLKEQKWTSLQLTEARSVLNNFLKPKYKKCNNCKAKNPKISKPTFGWFHVSMSSDDARANVIRKSKLGRPFVGGSAEKDADDILSGRKLKKVKVATAHSLALLPTEVRDNLRLLWENESQLCSFIGDIQHDQIYKFGNTAGSSMFFLDTILVPPIKFRPPSKGGDSVMEHPQTVLLSKVLQCNISLGNAHTNSVEQSKRVSRWMGLQQSINVLFDSKTTMGQGKRDVASGICQLLEKKEGIFRQKIMGKRVNFACRSVISPDPFLAVNEIGIPPFFALRLTYPERVTPWNVEKLRDAVINGSEIHPGATHYVDKLSTSLLRPDKRARMSVARKLQSSRGVVTQPGRSSDYEFEGKFVFRHVQDGDIVLVNRQPTLHKPSIMAHVVRVLKGEKTLRMHYANCSTYNADFDGDEMNVHFPQDEISRAEAYNIVNANNQYIVPTRGEPLRGLIQDNIVSAVLLTKKDTFLSQDQYNQLLYSSGVSTSGPVPVLRKYGQKVCLVSSENEIQPLLPAILKPEPLWTGKQVISAVLNHMTRGCPPFTIEKEGKISRNYFESKATAVEQNVIKNVDVDKVRQKTKADGRTPIQQKHVRKEQSAGEETLYVFRNDLVRGVIDKAQFGSYGLIHLVHELYGPSTAGNLLSVLSRLFTVFLQMHGFTCGVDDLLLLENRNTGIKMKLEECEEKAKEAHCKFIGAKPDKIEPSKLQMELEKAIRRNGESAITRLDGVMRQVLGKLTTEINKDLFLSGLLKPFPKNCFSLMTTTGAKGSSVNFQQVSSLLGQQELEGKRVPRMVSGKTLPCFLPWDCTSRAGGYITDNFLTGLRPQEYYFHCMAGREGLVDTAVKTSRSGYLQRCLMKNLESLKVCYDHTVRDTDGSIIQFSYGEDGLDVHQTSFIAKFESLEENHEIFRKRVDRDHGKINSYIEKLPPVLKEKASKYIKESRKKRQEMVHPTMREPIVNYEDFMKLVEHKYFASLAQPGEPVGVIAAQSVGEPSTQMTLNTFHLAGHGEMNVTLGIPRLQEILMTASNDIKTPIMTCPLREGRSKDYAERLAAKLKKVSLADIIESMEVSVVPFSIENAQVCRIYKLKMRLYKPELYPPNTYISMKDCKKTLKVVFLRELEDGIQNHVLLLSRVGGIKNFTPESQSKATDDIDEDVSGSRSQGGGENDDDDDDDDDDGEDLGSDVQKQKQQARDEVEYEDGDEPDDRDLSIESEEDNHHSDDGELSHDKEIELCNAEDENSKFPSDPGDLTKSRTGDRKTKVAKKRKRDKAEVIKKKTDRAIFSSANGSEFEAHFKFTNEPYIMLAQIAEKAAKKVYIKNYGKIDQCQATDCSEQQVIYYGEDPKERKNITHQEKKDIPALRTAGLDFKALWYLQDDLDIRYIYTNNINAILKTYGVEAAREAIIREVQTVFGIYGVTVDIRHLSLIADFMTSSGGYRAMSRNGGIKESTTPFGKMSFETASKFIVEAAFNGQTDTLESPSARICLGLPVKLGTGCFDLMQCLEV